MVDLKEVKKKTASAKCAIGFTGIDIESCRNLISCQNELILSLVDEIEKLRQAIVSDIIDK